LLDRGAQAAELSGSGSTVVAVFPSKEEAQRAADGLERRADWKVWVTRTRTSQWPAIIDNSPAHA
jgi:4-diphosphocytidyl-2C-methyl-D-erythritol kinase